MENEIHNIERANKRLEALKGFYRHLAIYLVVNVYHTLSELLKNLGTWETLPGDYFDFGVVALWVFWGIGLAFHSMKVFSADPIFGKGWEERQIRKFMQKR